MPIDTLCGTIIEDDEPRSLMVACAECHEQFDAWDDGYYDTIEDEWYCSNKCVRKHYGIIRADREAERMEQEGID